jgi:hypothetical protein
MGCVVMRGNDNRHLCEEIKKAMKSDVVAAATMMMMIVLIYLTQIASASSQ